MIRGNEHGGTERIDNAEPAKAFHGDTLPRTSKVLNDEGENRRGILNSRGAHSMVVFGATKRD